mmetsp:Transcript_3667/g.6487  ORF Transcript_3667/g.6487 Transcript_3667/m.6487 type:complete len:316 (+) Transcript_3667:129-1076(+)|eukprot:CAMPEP_0168192466 /NCGR_PEP_ID=MMETSP0139_2-20121125/18063_1 /TAXON_ID=44445 /ORGANISM="Pseudo-nitzschia australis, Strain 10249 10 AB" /LENGTH=315 /DNA_ID=CAMNT_0008115707 /DNA_START=63 /DNA_END=1010 /DNA_ORIENTATION=-
MRSASSFTNRLWVAVAAGLASMSIVAICCVGFAEAFGTAVVYGPSAKELILLTSKLAAKEGYESFCICAPGQEAFSRRLMYGASNDEEEDDDDSGNTVPKATPISSGGDIQYALTRANTLILVCHDTPFEEKALNTLLNSAGSDLSKIVMLSKMGVSTGGGGFFGGGDSKLAQSEKTLRSVCQSKNLDLSIVRAGQLKGGGPGEPFENDFGLSKQYYNTLFELSEASCTMAHDRFTMGVDCTKGDTVDVPNALKLFGTKTSFDAAPYDTSRINAAMGTVMAAIHDKPVEFSVGTAKATTPPSREEWETIIAKMEV